MHVVTAEPLSARQSGVAIDDCEPTPDALACLIDRLQQRLGAGAVYGSFIRSKVICRSDPKGA